MLASSPMMSTSGSDQSSGTATRMASASPGPTDATSVSVVNAPPDVQKKSTKTSASVPSERWSFRAGSGLRGRRIRRVRAPRVACSHGKRGGRQQNGRPPRRARRNARAAGREAIEAIGVDHMVRRAAISLVKRP
jgi:hypothetical protein